MRTQTPTKRVYLLDPNEVDNLALDGIYSMSFQVKKGQFSGRWPSAETSVSELTSETFCQVQGLPLSRGLIRFWS